MEKKMVLSVVADLMSQGHLLFTLTFSGVATIIQKPYYIS